MGATVHDMSLLLNSFFIWPSKPDNKEARTHALRQTRCILKLQVGLKPQQSTAYPHSVVTARTHNRFAQFYFYMLENKFRYCGQPPAACYLCIFISVVTHQTCQLLELALSYFTWQGSSWSLRRHVKNKSFCRILCSLQWPECLQTSSAWSNVVKQSGPRLLHSNVRLMKSHRKQLLAAKDHSTSCWITGILSLSQHCMYPIFINLT